MLAARESRGESPRTRGGRAGLPRAKGVALSRQVPRGARTVLAARGGRASSWCSKPRGSRWVLASVCGRAETPRAGGVALSRHAPIESRGVPAARAGRAESTRTSGVALGCHAAERVELRALRWGARGSRALRSRGARGSRWVLAAEWVAPSALKPRGSR
jgi:hypothetical protein